MPYRRKWGRMALALAMASIPTAANACEPIIPLAQLIGGSGLAGTLLLTQSVVWLLVAVAIKSVAFVFLERRLPWRKAICFMLIGNVLSTIPGLLAATFAGALTLLAVPIIFGLGTLAQRRLLLLSEQTSTRRFSGKRSGVRVHWRIRRLCRHVLFGRQCVRCLPVHQLLDSQAAVRYHCRDDRHGHIQRPRRVCSRAPGAPSPRKGELRRNNLRRKVQIRYRTACGCPTLPFEVGLRVRI